MEHIVILRSKHRAIKPVILTGSASAVGTALRTFVPAARGQYFRVLAKELQVLCGNDRPVREIRPLEDNEIPEYVGNLGGNCILTVIYSEGAGYKVYTSWNAPSYLKWCVGMVSSMFAECLVFVTVRDFLRALTRMPRWKTALERGACSFLPRLRKNSNCHGEGWWEMEFNNRIVCSTVSKGGAGDIKSAIVEIWSKHLHALQPIEATV